MHFPILENPTAPQFDVHYQDYTGGVCSEKTLSDEALRAARKTHNEVFPSSRKRLVFATLLVGFAVSPLLWAVLSLAEVRSFSER